MYQREVARYRVEDMIREAEAFRRSKDAATARASYGRGRVRRAAAAVLAVMAWPGRH